MSTEIANVDNEALQRAIAAAAPLKLAVDAMAQVEAVRAAHGELVAGLMAIQLQQQIEASLNVEAKGLLLAGAGNAYEVIGNVNPEEKIRGVCIAIGKGYKIKDDRGMHFAIFAKGGVITIMPKEMGYRSQLEKMGASDIDCQAYGITVQPRPNDPKKFDMLVTGFAKCTINGVTVSVNRLEEMPMRLPCYESDTPDKTEAQGKRRLMRDLWQKVSGVREVTDTDDVEDVIVVPSKVIERQNTAGEEPQTHPAESSQVDPYEPFRKDLRTAGKVAKAISKKLFGTTTTTEVDAIMAESEAAKKDGMSQRDFDRLERFANFHLTQIMEVVTQ